MKRFKLIFGVTVIVIFYSCNLFAQENLWYEKDFPAYTKYLEEKFGIECKAPEKFTDLNQYYILWKVRKDPSKHTGSMYGPIFQSKNKECIVMYPTLPSYASEDDMEIYKITAMINHLMSRDTSTVKSKTAINNSSTRGQINAEIKTALGLYYSYGSRFNNDTAKFDFNSYVTIIAGKKAHEMFNGDSIYIYNIPGGDSVYFLEDESLEKMRKSKYPFCTGVYISKKDRGGMDIKFFFTEKGKKKEEKYIDMVSKQVWYDEKFKND